METLIDAGDVELPATLDRPSGAVRGGLVVLHGAAEGRRSYFLYAHLGRLLASIGVAVLRYDRRTRVDGADVPLERQAEDAAAAITVLRQHIGEVPIGLWGLSQGAWAAPLAAAAHPRLVAFLVLVSSCGVSPAAQMRHGTAEQLRRHGHTESDIAELRPLRSAVEDYHRGLLDHAAAQRVVDQYAAREWFRHAYIPRHLPQRAAFWRDMDFDPAPTFARVSCPVLAFYGDTDAWMPID